MTPAKPHGWDSSGRKQRLREAGTSGWDEQKAAKRVMRRDAGICHVCLKPGSDRVDHVIPLSEGGRDDDANKAPIHQVPCHRDKTNAEAAAGRAKKSRRRPTEQHPGLREPG